MTESAPELVDRCLHRLQVLAQHHVRVAGLHGGITSRQVFPDEVSPGRLRVDPPRVPQHRHRVPGGDGREAGPTLTAELLTLAAVLGAYPHAPMQVTRMAGRRPRVGASVPADPGAGGGRVSGGSGPRPQTTRNVKIVCVECGNTARTTRKWIDAGKTPLCPCNLQPMAPA